MVDGEDRESGGDLPEVSFTIEFCGIITVIY